MEPKEVYADALKKITLLYKIRHTATENQVELLDAIIKDYTEICAAQVEIINANFKKEMAYLRKVQNEQAS